MYFFRHFKNHNLGKEHFFHLLFPIYLFVTFISEFENTQNSFSFGPPYGPFWSVKYLNFWPKATNSDSSSHFSRK